MTGVSGCSEGEAVCNLPALEIFQAAFVLESLYVRFYMKRCGVCEQTKPVVDFHKRVGHGDGYRDRCKDCAKTYHQEHYQKNKGKYVTQARNHQKRLRQMIQELKTGQTCADCQKPWPYYVLQHDHLPGTLKMVSIARIDRAGYSVERVLAELAKCELVCSNCHAERTHRRMKSAGSRQEV